MIPLTPRPVFATLVAGTLFLLLPMTPTADAQSNEFNYDESKVPQYTLPDPLILENGDPVRHAGAWALQRRPEVLQLFEEHVYGRQGARPRLLQFDIREESRAALGGQATRRQITCTFSDDPAFPKMEILVYLPNGQNGPVPLFVAYNFYGNHTIHTDPAIHLSTSWMRNNDSKNTVNHRATEQSRGTSDERWAVEAILERGYGLATIYYGDIEPDHAEGWKNGIRAHIHHDDQGLPLEPEDWGAIGAWAWGLSRAMDYFETDSEIDADRIAVMGHSRLGKTSLWAGATDERFAVTISNDSGCGGAALSRRRYGETVNRINTSFPHWFCSTFKKYNDNEDALPVDQHQLIALMAPRPVYVASAEEDRWADPKGEFLSAKHAGPVYELYGLKGVGVDRQPPIHEPVGGHVGYHVRAGKHDVQDYDWERYLDFADRHMKGK